MVKGLVVVTDSNFEETVNDNSLVLVDFWASWCGPCRALTPMIQELAEAYAGKVLICKLNVDENPNVAERFQVFSIPTLILFSRGREADRIVGLIPKKSIETVLKKYLG